MLYIPVPVEQRDIDRGSPCSGECCPLARAISRALHRRISVGCSHYTPVNDFCQAVHESIRLPDEAIKFRKDFDKTVADPDHVHSCVPTTFIIPVPEELAP